MFFDSNRRHLGCVLATILCLQPSTAFARSCKEDLPQLETQTIGSFADKSFVKFSKTGSDVTHSGTGTVIDVANGLILTAAHVLDFNENLPLSEQTGFFRFESDALGEYREAKVLFFSPRPNGGQEDSGGSWGKLRDIAVLKASSPLPLTARQLDVQEVSRSRSSVEFYGYFGGAQTSQYGNGKLSIPSPIAPQVGTLTDTTCVRSFRENTIGGDSGASVINSNGKIVGVIYKDRYRSDEGLVIPASCFFDEILKEIWQDNALSNERIAPLFTAAANGNTRRLTSDLSSSIYSNFEIALLIAMLKSALERAALDDVARFSSGFQCAVSVAFDRGIELPLFYPSSRLAATYIKSVGDKFAQEGLKALSAGDEDGAVSDFMAARSLLLGSLDQSVIGEQPELFGFRLAPKTTTDAITLKSLADLSIQIAKLDDHSDRKLRLSEAAQFAAAAAIGTSNRDLRGAAFASLGEAAVLNESFQVADVAYSEAIGAGFSPSWVLQGQRLSRVQNSLRGIDVKGGLDRPALQSIASGSYSVMIGSNNELEISNESF